MAVLPVFDTGKNKVGSLEVSDGVFAAEIRPHLLNEAVRAQVARRYEYRTANSKTRTEVRGTRKKMYKQKGTGQARHGDAKAPIFVGGGKAHGPHPRRVRHKINKKVMRAALVTALSLQHKEDRLFVIDKLELPKPNTKAVANCLSVFGLKKSVVVNTEESDIEKSFNQSSRNIRSIKFLRPEGLNVFDLLKYENLLISKKAAEKLAERLTHV